MGRNYMDWVLENARAQEEPRDAQVSRRFVLKGSMAAGAGLLLGVGCKPKKDKSAPKTNAPTEAVAPTSSEPSLNAFVRIAPDNTVTVVSKHIEFGQGTYTGMATLVAEELDADWSQVRVESAPADASRYNNLFYGPMQGTGGSTSMANAFMQMRQAGATARAMLLAAAAAQWQVDVAELTTSAGTVQHAGSKKTATYGELAERAAALEVPDKVPLKDPKDFKLIGKSAARVDVPGKLDGSAQFTIDTYLPDMVTAVVARPTRFGGKVKSVDDAAARKVSGVVDVVQVPSGVAVLAKNFWAAKKARQALRITWDDSAAEKRGSAEIMDEYRTFLDQPGKEVRNDGDVATALAGAARVLTADYEFPFLVHAPMEPLDCAVRLSKDKCEIWAGSQSPTSDLMAASRISGLTPDKIEIHTMLAGGSFGRRATPDSDVVSEATHIAKAIDGRFPVKLVWTREDDIRGGRYRPMYLHRLVGGLDKDGNIVAWQQRVIGQSIMKGTPLEALAMRNGIDPTMLEGASTLPYAIPNLAVDVHVVDVGVPPLWWRSVGHTHTAFTTEVFFDELVRAAGRDPLQERLKLLADHPRLHRVVELVGEKSGWGTPLPAGKARGIAMHKSFNSFVAEVAEVSLAADGMPRVERVVCAVDCGVPVNPDNIRAQMEGGIGYGLAAALHNELILEGGRVVQSNFHDYQPMRMHEMPPVEVHIVPSAEPPTGVGEPGVPPIAPAVANAMAQLIDRPIRKQPFRRVITEGAKPS